MKESLTSAIFPFMSDNLFRLLFSSTTEGIILIDLHGQILLTNKYVDDMFGYPSSELKGKLIDKLISSKHGRSYEIFQKKSFPNTKTDSIEDLRLMGLKKNGSQFPITIRMNQFSSDNEEFVFVFITGRSKKKEFEDSNRKEGQLSEKYFDIAEVILLALNAKGEITEINRKGCEVLGYLEEELIGENWMKLSIENSKEEKLEKVFKSVLSEDDRYQTYDNWVVTKSGEKRLIHWQNTIVKDLGGKVVGTLSSGTDITEKNKMIKTLEENEKKLRAYSKDLEKQVEKRTRELAESLEKEKGLNEMKSKFVSLASHEFRTPLSTILSSASLIAKYPKGDMNEKRLKHVNRIKSSVSHLNGILEDFLSLDKLEEGGIQCEPEEFNLQELLEEVVSTLEEIIKPGQNLEFKCDGKPCVLRTDKKLVRNILYNLTSNALKYSPENKPVAISTQLKKEYVLIEISDEGIGIPVEEHEHLFTRFFRASNTQGYQGTGLGLNIVKKYVDLLGGEISFESGRGEGTTFRVKFPATLTG